ncbi:MAG: hypothetical protein U9R02_09675 [Thermodesulfobacteriota bacterium]|nr:hypothetical protein [Thermodesulfobacteriota bacterium]
MRKYSDSGQLIRTCSSNSYWGLAFDESDQSIWAACRTNGTLENWSASGELQKTISGFSTDQRYVTIAKEEQPTLAGDINGNKVIDLVDVICGLKIMSGVECTEEDSGADVNGDGRLGVHEILYVLQKVSGLR